VREVGEEFVSRARSTGYSISTVKELMSPNTYRVVPNVVQVTGGGSGAADVVDTGGVIVSIDVELGRPSKNVVTCAIKRVDVTVVVIEVEDILVTV
jgi:hypothetical protein